MKKILLPETPRKLALVVDKDDEEQKGESFSNINGFLMIFGGSTINDTQRRQKVAR